VFDPIELAWAGGLFDGEGSIGINKTRYTPKLRLQMAMTDADAVERFQRAVGGSMSGPYIQTEGRKPIWHWTLTGKKAWPVLHALMPYLCERRRSRALEVVDAVL
jgi:hypothetical protein